MDRRTILKGIATAATAPVSAFANVTLPPAPSEAASIHALVEDHRLAKAAAHAATEIENVFLDSAGCPPYPSVEVTEFPSHYVFGGSARRHALRSPEMIDGMINRYEQALKLNCVRGNPRAEARLAHGMRDAAAERARLQALFGERKAAFKAWSAASGHNKAQANATAAWDKVAALDERIFDAECTTVDDIRAKAGFLADEYGKELSKEAANRFITELAAFKGREA